MQHENLNPFIGAVIDPPNECIVSNYCPKGSLQVTPVARVTAPPTPEKYQTKVTPA